MNFNLSLNLLSLQAPTLHPPTEPPCIDEDPDCEERGPDVCFQNQTFAEKNCRVFCLLCTRTFSTINIKRDFCPDVYTILGRDLINNMDRTRNSGTEPSSVILSQKISLKS